MRRTLLSLFGIVIALMVISPAWAQPAVDQLERRLRAGDDADQTGYLGVIADDRAAAGGGVELLEIVAGGPAAKAGLESGDVITKIDERPVRTLDDFARALEGRAVGAKIRFTLERQGKPKLAEVTLGGRPPAKSRRFPNFGRIEDSRPPRMSLLGVRVEAVEADSPIAADLPALQGAYVVRVAEGSPAAQAGIPLHAVIVAVDDQEVTDPADLKEIIAATRPGQEIKVGFYSRGKLAERRVRLAELLPEGAAAPPVELAEPAMAAGPAEPAEQLTAQQRIERLEQRVRELEARLAELEREREKWPSR